MIFPGALIDVLAAQYPGHGTRSGKIAFWSAAQMYVGGAIAIVLLFDHKGVLVYTLVMALAAIIPVVANGYQLWPEIRRKRTIDLPFSGESLPSVACPSSCGVRSCSSTAASTSSCSRR